MYLKLDILNKSYAFYVLIMSVLASCDNSNVTLLFNLKNCC